MKTVKRLYFAEMVDMGGMPVRQPLPTRQVEQIDPFLLLHHHRGEFPGLQHPRSLGVPPHPHRGFSPVTFVIEGEVHHRDSLGNSTVVGAGGVQWLKAGRGITHSERPSMELAHNGGVQEILQLWVNLPAKNKMDPPRYWNLAASDLPPVGPSSSALRLVSGKLGEKSGAAQDETRVTSVFGELKAGDSFEFPVEAGQNSALYVVRGKVKVNGYGAVDALHLAEFEANGDAVELEAVEDTYLLLLAAPPLHEPVATYGPIVMNTTTEIMEALRDAQQGKMGFLVEEFPPEQRD